MKKIAIFVISSFLFIGCDLKDIGLNAKVEHAHKIKQEKPESEIGRYQIYVLPRHPDPEQESLPAAIRLDTVTGETLITYSFQNKKSGRWALVWTSLKTLGDWVKDQEKLDTILGRKKSSK